MRYNSSPGPIHNPHDAPIHFPGGFMRRVGPLRWSGPKRSGARANPYDYRKSASYLANSARIFVGLKAGTRFVPADDAPREFAPGEEIDPAEIERAAKVFRRAQVGRGFEGLNFGDSRGVYRGADEETLEILLFPQGWGDDPPEVARADLSEIDSGGGMGRFWANVEELARGLGESFEQDKLIVAVVENGVSKAIFYTWEGGP